jgi:hypothetical protein
MKPSGLNMFDVSSNREMALIWAEVFGEKVGKPSFWGSKYLDFELSRPSG